MTPNSGWIQATVLRVQNEFLDHPALSLTTAQAAGRFALDPRVCDAVLGALLEAGVLARTPEGTYVRFFPGFASTAAARQRNARDGRHADTLHAA